MDNLEVVVPIRMSQAPKARCCLASLKQLHALAARRIPWLRAPSVLRWNSSLLPIWTYVQTGAVLATADPRGHLPS